MRITRNLKILTGIITLLHLCVFTSAQNRSLDSLKLLLNSDHMDTNRIIHLQKITWRYLNIGNYDSAMIYGRAALQLSEMLVEDSVKMNNRFEFQKFVAGSYNNVGVIYFDIGNYQEALRNYFIALKIDEKIGHSKGKADVYNNLGNLAVEQNNYKDALEYYTLSLEIKLKLADQKNISSSYNNIGNVYDVQGNYPEALKNHMLALEIRKSINDKRGMGTSYNNIGLVYAHQAGILNPITDKKIIAEKFAEALKNYFVSIKIKEDINDRSGLASTYLNVAAVYIDQKKYKLAEDFLLKARDLSKEMGIVEYLRDCYGNFALLDSALGDFKSAFNNHKLYILYKDSLDNDEIRKKTIQGQMTFDFEKNQAVANAEHKKELEKLSAISEEKSRKQIMVLFLVSGFGFLVLLFAGFIFRSLRVTRKQKVEIELQKQLVEEKQKEILDSIHYARRIQISLMPTEKYIEKNLNKLKK